MSAAYMAPDRAHIMPDRTHLVPDSCRDARTWWRAASPANGELTRGRGLNGRRGSGIAGGPGNRDAWAGPGGSHRDQGRAGEKNLIAAFSEYSLRSDFRAIPLFYI